MNSSGVTLSSLETAVMHGREGQARQSGKDRNDSVTKQAGL